jgi:LacI family transcriptional regulator
MKATSKQIAEMAGVHRSTVDKVLHGREGVSDEVRARVQKIIDELDYQPNPIGKALARQNNPLIIAVLLLDVDAIDEIKSGISDAYEELKNFGLKLEYYVNNLDNRTEQLYSLRLLAKKKLAGLIISPIRDPEIVKAINSIVDAGTPVVTINTDVPDSKRMCFIGQDAFSAGRVAGQLMGEILGNRGKVAIITSSAELLGTLERQQGFEAVISDQFSRIQIVEIIETHEQALPTFQKTLAMLNSRDDIDGIYITCGNVSEVCRAVRLLNKEQAIKIISFDTYPEIVELVKSGIINFTIGQNLHAQGYRSLKVLFDRVFNNKEPDSAFVLTKIDIFLRENISLN